MSSSPRHIAIIGLSPSVQSEPPIGDPNWELWGLAIDHRAPFLTRRFQMHTMGHVLWDKTLARVQELNTPVYMQRRYPEAPASVEFPLRDVIEDLYPHGFARGDQTDWFQSQIAYMIALAIHEKPDTIGIWGVSAKDEYEHQQANLEHLIGIAIGRGIAVYLPSDTDLCRYRPIKPIWPRRYGYEEEGQG